MDVSNIIIIISSTRNEWRHHHQTNNAPYTSDLPLRTSRAHALPRLRRNLVLSLASLRG